MNVEIPPLSSPTPSDTANSFFKRLATACKSGCCSSTESVIENTNMPSYLAAASADLPEQPVRPKFPTNLAAQIAKVPKSEEIVDTVKDTIQVPLTKVKGVLDDVQDSINIPLTSVASSDTTDN